MSIIQMNLAIFNLTLPLHFIVNTRISDYKFKGVETGYYSIYFYTIKAKNQDIRGIHKMFVTYCNIVIL